MPVLMWLIPSVAEATAPLSTRGATRTLLPATGARPRAPRRPLLPPSGEVPRRGDRGAFCFASPFRSCRRGALRFASPLRSPARYSFGFADPFGECARRDGILSLCLSKEKEPKRNNTREGKIAISFPPETHPNSNAQEGSAPLGSPPGRTDSPEGICVSQILPAGHPPLASPSGEGIAKRRWGRYPAGRGQAPPLHGDGRFPAHRRGDSRIARRPRLCRWGPAMGSPAARDKGRTKSEE